LLAAVFVKRQEAGGRGQKGGGKKNPKTLVFVLAPALNLSRGTSELLTCLCI
jgi:hypothetical protein